MTISNASRTAGPFIGDGVTVAFPFSYKVFTRADVLVASTVTATSVETVLVLDADYSITLNADQNSSPGGVIVLAVPLPVGTFLAATSNISALQPLDLTNSGGFYPTAINQAFDRVVILIQQLTAKVGPGLNVGGTALINLITSLSTSAGSSFVGFIQGLVGAIARTLQDKAREVVSVKDFGVKGDGTTNDLAKLQVAAAAMRSDMELHFPPGRYKFAWAGAKPERNTVALDLFQLSNIKIVGHGATLVVTNHDVGQFGGLLFCHLRACKNVEIYGFNIEMSFVGTNVSAACYPESGFLYGHNTLENVASGSVAAIDRLENINVHDNTFSIQSQYGAYTTSPNAYQGDNNNGGKYYSIFLRGEQSEAVYVNQNKGITIENNTWSDQHQAYGVWVWGFSNVAIIGNKWHGQAVRTADYLNTTLGGSVPPIRCHKFFTRNWRISQNIIQGRVAPNRVGAFDGSSAFISFQQEATAYDPESVVTIDRNTLIVGSNPTSLADYGIQILCGGNFDILNNTFGCASAIVAATGIQINDPSSYNTGISQYFNILGNTFSAGFSKGQPIIYTSASSVSAAARSIKSLIVKGNVFNAYYAGIVQKVNMGQTYEGVAFQVISDNAVNGTNNTGTPPANAANIAIDVAVPLAADVAQINSNIVAGCYIGIRGSGAGTIQAANNKVTGATFKPLVGVNNYAPAGSPVVNSFASAANVVVAGSANKLFNCSGIALDATGLVKDTLAGMYPGGTTIVAAPTGFTWKLTQWEVGDSA